jgi:AcrR family transcriptional regulator
MRNQADSTVALRSSNGKGREILEAAAEMFLQRGYESTTISEIANSVGLLPSSLYHYARSKEELLYTVAKLTHEDNRSLLDLSTYEATRPSALVEEFVVRNLTYIAEHPAYVVTFDLEYRKLSDEHRAEIVRLRREFRHFLTKLIKDGQQAGEIDASLDPKLTSIAILSLLNGVARWYTVRGEWSAKEVVDVHRHIVLTGIVTTRSGKR